MSDLVEVDPQEPTEEDRFFDSVKLKFRIDSERFELGKQFASIISEGTVSAYEAYADVFKVEKLVAQKKSAKLKHTKWVQELVRYYQHDEGLEYISEKKEVLKVLYGIARDTRASNRERTDASKSYLEAVKQEQAVAVKAEDALTKSDVANMIGGLMAGIHTLSQSGKMINAKQEVIDVPILE